MLHCIWLNVFIAESSTSLRVIQMTDSVVRTDEVVSVRWLTPSETHEFHPCGWTEGACVTLPYVRISPRQRVRLSRYGI